MKKVVIFVISAILVVSVLVSARCLFISDREDITVFISVTCDTVNDNYDLLDNSLKDTKYIPRDGVILTKTPITVKNGDTVLDLTRKATSDNGIQLEFSQSLNDAYVQGINYLYEFSCGDLSGWMYSVNGSFANVGCNDYILQDGDYVAWQYTCDLGKDLDEVTE